MMYFTQQQIKQTLPARALALLVFSAVLLVSNPVRAATIILGNLPSSADAGSNALSTTNHKAVSFNMGSEAFQLDSVVLRLNRDSFGGGPTDPIVELRDDSSDPLIPGTTLFTFPNPIAPASGFNDEVFAPPPFTMFADTTYWLVVTSGSVAGDSNLLWSASFFPGITPMGVGATLGNYRSSSDGGAIWNSSTFQNSFQIDGTVVPIPAAAWLFGSALIGLISLSRRNKTM